MKEKELLFKIERRYKGYESVVIVIDGRFQRCVSVGSLREGKDSLKEVTLNMELKSLEEIEKGKVVRASFLSEKLRLFEFRGDSGSKDLVILGWARNKEDFIEVLKETDYKEEVEYIFNKCFYEVKEKRIETEGLLISFKSVPEEWKVEKRGK